MVVVVVEFVGPINERRLGLQRASGLLLIADLKRRFCEGRRGEKKSVEPGVINHVETDERRLEQAAGTVVFANDRQNRNDREDDAETHVERDEERVQTAGGLIVRVINVEEHGAGDR